MRSGNTQFVSAIAVLLLHLSAVPSGAAECEHANSVCGETVQSTGDIRSPEALKGLLNSAWDGSAELWLDPRGYEVIESDATMTIGEGVITYSWSFKGKEQAGRFTFSGHGVNWQDSWHQPQQVSCAATSDPTGFFSVVYSYPAGSGPDWHWRMKLSQRPDDALVLQMTNIAPWGEEARAVRMVLQQRTEGTVTADTGL